MITNTWLLYYAQLYFRVCESVYIFKIGVHRKKISYDTTFTKEILFIYLFNNSVYIYIYIYLSMEIYSLWDVPEMLHFFYLSVFSDNCAYWLFHFLKGFISRWSTSTSYFCFPSENQYHIHLSLIYWWVPCCFWVFSSTCCAIVENQVDFFSWNTSYWEIDFLLLFF